MVRREQTQHRLWQHHRWSERVRRAALLAVLIAVNVVATAPAQQARSQSLQAMPPQYAQSQYAQSQHARSARRLPPVRELVAQYRELALRAEFGGEARRGRIIKWAGPIIAELRGKNLDVYEPEVLHHMVLLTRLTRLQFHTVRASRHDAFSAGPKPNMIITFVHNGGRGPRNLENVCYARVFSGRDFIIRRAEIRIHADWNLLRRHCILEELTQALGLMNDSSYFNPSIFNDHSKQQVLSPWDRLMVRAHYDRRLLPGMTWIYAEPIVRDHFRSYIATLYRPVAKHRKVRRKKRRR